MTKPAIPAVLDPIEARVAELEAERKRKEDDDRNARHRIQATMEARAKELAAYNAVPANWATRMARSGATSLALTWAGCPVAPDLCVPTGTPFSITPAGVHYTPENGKTAGVMSPCVSLGDGHRFAAHVDGKWKVVDIPLPVERIRPDLRVHQVIGALKDAGVVYGGPIDRSTRDVSDVIPAVDMAGIWLLGIHKDTIVGSPVCRLGEVRPEDARPDSSADRLALAQSLTRLPADVGLDGRR